MKRDAQPAPAPEADPFWIGRELADCGAISEEQLDGAKRFWRRDSRESFAAVLERLGLSEGRRLAELTARLHRLPLASLASLPVDRDAARLLPQATAVRKCVAGFSRTDRRLAVALADPAAYGPDEARADFPGYEVRLHVAPRGEILALLEEAWRPAAAAQEDGAGVFSALLEEAVAEGATDLHLEPRERSVHVRHRIDGRLVHRRFLGGEARDPLIQAAKLAGKMDIAERRLPQDGQGSICLGPRRHHLRYSCLPSIHGESIVVHIIGEDSGLRSFEEMGLLPREIGLIRGLLRLPHGLVYVTGPTGAGKTTLLYSMLNSLPPRELSELKIVTLEDPVEIRQPRWFLQLEVDERIGRGFSELLRHVLRHDPDVLLVGETRDRATAEITFRAALTGHLCFSTLHTPDALGAIRRLRDLGLDSLTIAGALKGVIAQRLVRRPCERCRRPHARSEEWLSRHADLWSDAGVDPKSLGFFAACPGRECPACRGRGYRGVTPIIEVYPLSGSAERLAGRAEPDDLLPGLRAMGCRSLRENGILKAALGATTMEEVSEALEPEAAGCYHPSARP